MKFILSIIFLMDCAFDVGSTKTLPCPRSSRFSPMLFSRSFIVLCFILRYMTYFELIFLKSIFFFSLFFVFCMWMSSCSNIICWKHSLCSTFTPLSKISWPYLCGSISGHFVLFHWSICLLFCQQASFEWTLLIFCCTHPRGSRKLYSIF